MPRAPEPIEQQRDAEQREERDVDVHPRVRPDLRRDEQREQRAETARRREEKRRQVQPRERREQRVPIGARRARASTPSQQAQQDQEADRAHGAEVGRRDLPRDPGLRRVAVRHRRQRPDPVIADRQQHRRDPQPIRLRFDERPGGGGGIGAHRAVIEQRRDALHGQPRHDHGGDREARERVPG